MHILLAIQRSTTITLLIAALGFTLLGGTAAVPFPDTIPLPDGFQPEGIATGAGPTFFVGSIPTGAIYRGDLVTGQGKVFISGQPGRAAIGMKYDSRSHLLFVAGGPTGKAFIYDGDTGATIAEVTLTTAQPTFINDVVVTREAAYFTDSMRQVFYKVLIAANGALNHTGQEIPLTGEYEFVPGAFNANGIEAVPDSGLLIIVNSTTGNLYTVDPGTGISTRIHLGGDSVQNGDGILLEGKTLYVVQNSFNQIAVVELSDDFGSGEIVRLITSNLFRVPTTIARFGDGLYAVNARFGTPPTPDTDYEVVRVSQ